MDSDEPYLAEECVKATLEYWGFKVRRIPPKKKRKVPDFLVQGEGRSYLVEVKTKLDNPYTQTRKHDALSHGKVHVETQTDLPRNVLGDIVDKAAQQLNAEHQDVDFRLLWLVALGEDSENQIERFISTLYGRRKIGCNKGDEYTLFPCYGLTRGKFKQLEEQLDGAIVGDPESACLCLNHYSIKHQMLRNSKLGRCLNIGTIDPLKEERLGHAFIADKPIPDRDWTQVTDDLRRKYKINDLTIVDEFSISTEQWHRSDVSNKCLEG